jgi:hypothetical protein
MTRIRNPAVTSAEISLPHSLIGISLAHGKVEDVILN